MKHINIIRLKAAAAFAALLVSLPALGQETSPYSKFGYGMLGDNATSAQQQMGGTGYAMHSGRQINAMNPASYAMVDSMTFLCDMGVTVTRYWRQDATGRAHDWGGGLDYITILFPVSHTLGVSAGLLPFSSVGYAFGSGIENGYAAHQGSGGINQLYAGLGWATPLKGLRVGANISYLFGNTYNSVFATASNLTQAAFEQTMEVQDYRLRFGLQYTRNLDSRHQVTAAFTYDPGKSLQGKTYVLKYLQNTSQVPDTVAPGVVNLKNHFALAASYGVGLAWDFERRLHVEADFTYQPWKNAKYSQIENFSSSQLTDRWKIAAGASFQPNPRGSYLQRVTYRAGSWYDRDYIMAAGNRVGEWGIDWGLGLPASSTSKTIVNLGFQWKQRTSSPVNLLKERYLGVSIGVNFNGTWFYRNKLR